MSFLSAILIFILIVWLLGQLLRRFFPQILMWMVGRRMRSQMNDFQARQREYAQRGRQQQQEQQRRRKASRRRGKIFGRGDGEYVEFEEVKVYGGSAASDAKPSSDFKPEPQVTDAEWEDIK